MLRLQLLQMATVPWCQSSVLGPLCPPFKWLVSELAETLHERVYVCNQLSGEEDHEDLQTRRSENNSTYTLMQKLPKLPNN